MAASTAAVREQIQKQVFLTIMKAVITKMESLVSNLNEAGRSVKEARLCMAPDNKTYPRRLC